MVNDEKNQNEEADNNTLGHNNPRAGTNQLNEQEKREFTEEQRQKRAIETGKIFEDKGDLIKARAEREKRKKEEIVELQSGARFTIGEIERIVSIEPQPYDPLFPYWIPYFKQTYRLYYPERS